MTFFPQRRHYAFSLSHTLESDTTNHPKYLSLKNPSHQAAGVQVHAFQLVNQVELKEGGLEYQWIYGREKNTRYNFFLNKLPAQQPITDKVIYWVPRIQ